MGLLDLFRRKALSASPSVVEALQDRRVNFYPPLGGTNQRVSAAYQRGIDASYGWIYATQPAVRSVIDFIARNASQLSLKLYERVDDNERQRDEDHPAARSLAKPNERTSADAFIYRLFTDFLIWDNAYVLKFRTGPRAPLTLIRLPPNGVTVSGGRFTPEVYTIWRYDGTFYSVRPADILHWYGYNPDDPLLGLSKLETLRAELATDRAIQTSLVELAKSGLKGGYIKRPLDAPEWSQEDADRFVEQWREGKLKGDPILEEGMEWEQTGIAPKDAELLASRRFTKEEVASLYGVPMAAMGGTDSPNADEQRKLVYGDVLPPYTNLLADQLNVDILKAEYGETDYYFEFDLNSKLAGNVETRVPQLTAAAGGPWMTRNEVRSKENLPPLEGGDDLIVPLNVMKEGETRPALPAPNVMPPQDPNKPPQDGSHREEPKALSAGTKQLERTTRPRREADMGRQRRYIDEAKALLDRFYTRQANALRSKGAKDADSERWNRELATDIEKFVKSVVEREGGVYVARLTGDDFDIRQVENYIKAMAEGTAEGLNRVTQQDIEALGTVDAMARASNLRAEIAGASIGTRATVFARIEAAKQAPGTHLRKQTWIANTERHSELDGVSVPLGSDWGGIEPGSEPNCSCSLSVS